MLKAGILNPQINSLLSRVRHAKTLVIADRGFPFWPQIETIDLSPVDNIPTVLNILNAISANFAIANAWMALEFLEGVLATTQNAYKILLPAIGFEPPIAFKRRIPAAIGLIRTADTPPYSNEILESA